jgi:hypothetical protein
MSDVDPLPGELSELYAAESATPAAAPATRAAVRAKLAASVGMAPLGHAAAAATISAAGKVVVTVAIIAAISGATVAVVLGRGAPQPRQHAGPSGSVNPAIPQPFEATPSIAQPREPTATAPAPSPGSAAPPRSMPRPSRAQHDAVSDEPTLLRDAWHALSADAPARALELVEIDQRAHPGAPLAEERDALRVIALARLHRARDARAAQARFVEEYPDSVHRELVERAVAEMEKTP